MLLTTQQMEVMYFAQQMKDDPHHSKPEDAVIEASWSNHYDDMTDQERMELKQKEIDLLAKLQLGLSLLKDYRLVIKYRSQVHTMSNGKIQGEDEKDLLGIIRVQQGHIAHHPAYCSVMAFPKKSKLKKFLPWS